MDDEESEQTEMEMGGEDFQILDARYDVSDPEHPRLISSRRGRGGGKKRRNANAQAQADLRQRRKEQGIVLSQAYIPESKKEEFSQIAKMLGEDRDILREADASASAQAELAQLQENFTSAQEQLAQTQAELAKAENQVEQLKPNLRKALDDLRKAQKRIRDLEKLPKWIRGLFGAG